MKTPMKYIRISSYNYQLVDDYSVILPEFEGVDFVNSYFWMIQGVLVARDGYAWDGPSGPTLHTREFVKASLVHDVLYQAMRAGYLSADWRKPADDVLYRMCREGGMPFWRARYVYQFVRWFGGGAVRPRAVEPMDEVITI